MDAAAETVQMLTMVVLIGFTSPVDGEFAPVRYSFYKATAEQCRVERESNQDARRRVLCLDRKADGRRSVQELLREHG